MVLRKKGAAKLWELWTASYQTLTARPGKSVAFVTEKLNNLLLHIARHLPLKEAMEATAIIARSRPPADVLHRALDIYAQCVDRNVDTLLTEVPEIMRQLSLPPTPLGVAPHVPPHRYLDTEVRMKELMVRLI